MWKVGIFRDALRFVKRCFRFLRRRSAALAEGIWAVFGSRYVSLEVAEVLLQQNTPSGFNRYDTIVRYLAIENYYGENSHGFGLYREMQRKRCGGDYEVRLDIFKKLIRSYEEKGYDVRSAIELNADLTLRDGSHRLAMALYTGEKQITCKVFPFTSPVEYGAEWFMENGFGLSEIKALRDRAEDAMQKFRGGYFCHCLAACLPVGRGDN